MTELSDGVGLSVRDVTRELLANQWAPLQHEGASLGTATSAAARFLSGSVPLCQVRVAQTEADEKVDGLELLPLHPFLAQEFGKESILLRMLAARQPLAKLGTNLAVIGTLFPTQQDGEVAMAAVLGEVIEGIVEAAVGLDTAFEYMTACLS